MKYFIFYMLDRKMGQRRKEKEREREKGKKVKEVV